MLPFVETVALVGLPMLLPIRDHVEPVLDNLAHLDELAPSIEHLRLQVVVCAVPALPTTD